MLEGIVCVGCRGSSIPTLSSLDQFTKDISYSCIETKGGLIIVQ